MLVQLAASIRIAVAAARRRLHSAGISDDEAALDARVLAQHVLGWDAARLLTSLNDPAPAAFAAAYETAVARRAAREPMAYITGIQEFRGLEFRVTPAVLIPRPETELIVDAALELFPGGRPLAIADVCTGGGCIAVTLAVERPRAAIVATDISSAALKVAAENAGTHHVSDRIRLVETDLLAGVQDGFDLIVANPPYVAGMDRGSLPPEVVAHEPAVALFGGADGLDVIRRLLAEVPRVLQPGGVLIFELGAGQAAAVTSVVGNTPVLGLENIRDDLQGIPRVAVVRSRL